MDLDDLRIPANRHGYIYLITVTRPTDGSLFYYVGQHTGQSRSSTYVGSGLRIKRFYQKYGKRGTKTLLMWAYSKEELDFYEIQLIQLAKLTYEKLCLNLAYGGARGKASDSSRAKASKSQSTPEKRAMYAALSTARGQTLASRKKLSIAKTGKPLSEHHRKRCSEGQTGNTRSLSSRRKQSITTRRINETTDINSRRSAALIGIPQDTFQCPVCLTYGGRPGMIRWHGINGEKCILY